MVCDHRVRREEGDMEPMTSIGQVQLWPLIMGWIVVCCLFLFSWRRQAILASAGMAIVTIAVLLAAQNA